jgi:hypothetical protein
MGEKMKAVTEFATKYLAYLLAGTCIGLATFFMHQVQADAVQDEKLKTHDSFIEIMRLENREDHKRIQDKLDALADAVRNK